MGIPACPPRAQFHICKRRDQGLQQICKGHQLPWEDLGCRASIGTTPLASSCHTTDQQNDWSVPQFPHL